MQRGDDVLLNTLFDFNDVLTVEPLATAYRNADSTITFTWNTNSDAETIAIHFDGTCTINNGLLGLFSNSKEYYSFSVEIDNDGSESYRGGYFLFSEDGRANNFLQAFFDGDLSFCSVDATFDIVSTENIGAPFAAGKVNLYRQSTISFRVDN